MALKLQYLKEESSMSKHVLAERTHIFVDPKTGEERLADLAKDKDNVFLLGPKGAEIPKDRAEALGLVKKEKAK